MELDQQNLEFMQLYSKAVPDVRAFLRKLLPSWHDVDEVLQETTIVLWKKFDSFEKGSNFTAWACVIARYEVLTYKRKKARDKHVFSDELLEIISEEALEQEEVLLHERDALKTCLSKLQDKQRKVLVSVYQTDQSIKTAAESLGKTATALYKMLRRLRELLLSCIEKELVKT